MPLARRNCLRLSLPALAAAALVPPPFRTAAAAAPGEVRERSMGDPNAPVTMIEYSSLTCPHCAAFHTEVLPGLKERFIDTGKVRLVMRDFPLDRAAFQAAIVAHCAGDARYFTFLNALFATQERWSRAPDPAAALEQFALAGGLPREAVRACLADKAMQDGVLQLRLTGQDEFRVESTPTFVINGTAYPGGRSLDAFAAIIEPLLPRG